jgi:hypothetical protein
MQDFLTSFDGVQGWDGNPSIHDAKAMDTPAGGQPRRYF